MVIVVIVEAKELFNPHAMASMLSRRHLMRVKTMKTVLAATIHDPQLSLLQPLKEHMTRLGLDGEPKVVAYSPPTHPRIVRALGDLGCITIAGSESVQSVYVAALERGLCERPDHIFYCDLDRLLHWVKAYPEEYHHTRRIALEYEFLMVGRTPRAFQTHPQTQTQTEGIANLVASRILGFNVTRDIIGVCWGLNISLVQLLLSTPQRNSYGFYCGWPVAAWRNSAEKAYVEVEGLEWETPDRYEHEIGAKGYESWLKNFMTPKEWERRNMILRDLVETLLDLAK